MVPKLALPQFLSQIRVLLKQLASGDSLQIFDNIRDRKLGRSGNETVDMVTFAAFKKPNRKALVIRNLLNKLFKIGLNFGCKNLTAVLDRPYHMVINIAH